MKYLTVLFFVFFALNIFAQEEIELEKKDGLVISYKLILKGSDSKKDKYLLLGKISNIGSKELYYSEQTLESNGVYLPMASSFATIKVRNTKGLLSGSTANFSATQTSYLTVKNEILFKIEPGAVYSEEFNFTVETGEQPIITSEFTEILRDLSYFDLRLNSEMVNGSYTSNCGNVSLTLDLQRKGENEVLLQTSNGKQFFWARTSEGTFTRLDGEFTLSYQKDGSLIYSISDGTTCEWLKQ